MVKILCHSLAITVQLTGYRYSNCTVHTTSCIATYIYIYTYIYVHVHVIQLNYDMDKLLIYVIIVDCGHAKYRPQSCLPGNKHKDSPSPEGPQYAACHSWQQSSCCTAEFTQQLSMAMVTNIDGFHWNR